MTYPSPIGNLELAFDGTALTALQLARNPSSLPSTIFTSTTSSSSLQSVCHWLDTYFSSRKPNFLPPLRPHGTPFQLRVWQELLKIPYGHTVTYGALARRVGCRSAQAVGQAVGHNPIAIIIPCHRVVSTQGLGGYAYGTDTKKYLLHMEHNTLQQ